MLPSWSVLISIALSGVVHTRCRFPLDFVYVSTPAGSSPIAVTTGYW